MTRKHRPFAHQVHEARPELHGRSFAPYGEKGKHPQSQKQRLADRHAHGQQPVPQFPRPRLQHRDGLRDPRAIGPREHVIAQPKNQGKSQRHDDEHRPRRRFPDHARQLGRLQIKDPQKQRPQPGQDRADQRRPQRPPVAVRGFVFHRECVHITTSALAVDGPATFRRYILGSSARSASAWRHKTVSSRGHTAGHNPLQSSLIRGLPFHSALAAASGCAFSVISSGVKSFCSAITRMPG